jgi:hypothetical protein
MQDQAQVTKKCIECKYEGTDIMCPNDGMIMEEKCQNCNECKSICICEKKEGSNT